MSIDRGLLATLEAKPGKGDELGAFLQQGRELAAAESGTVTWYAFKLSDTTYGIFDTFEGEDYIRETWLRADLSIVKAWRADGAGNLMFRKTARNFNPVMATAGKVTVVEAEEVVETGSLDPNCIHTPGIYVDRVVQSTISEKRVEKRTTRPR